MDLGPQESVALARDVLFLVLMLVVALVAFALLRKLSKTAKAAGKLVNSIKRMVELMRK